MRLTFLPSFRDGSELLDVLLRAGFYLSDVDVSCLFIVDFPLSDFRTLIKSGIPVGYDEGVVERTMSLVDRIDFASNRERAIGRIRESDALMIWNHDRLSKEGWQSLVEELRAIGTSVYAVDRFRDRLEGSQYIQARFDHEDDVSEVIQVSKDRLQAVAASNTIETVTLLGTGPSIGAWSAHDLSETFVIACNTTILDSELMKETRPQIITFADPIFHFGCSVYAARFRDALSTLAERLDFQIAIPLKYRGLFASLCPHLIDRTIAIPMRKRRPNVNLLENFEVRVTANVATLMMIPIASSLGTHVQMLGFDGRGAPETYFWRHNPRTQFEDELETIKTVHPAFFTEVDYSSYYDDHLAELERLLTEGEVHGRTYRSLEATHVAPLRKRTISLNQEALEETLARNTDFRVISLNPDYEDDFGHYGAYDAKLRQNVQEAGGDFITLASTAYEGDGAPWVIPTFTDPSWSLGRIRWQHHAERFQREFSNVLSVLARSESATPTVLIMYMATPRHLISALLQAPDLLKTAPMVANLFHSHKEMWELETGLRSGTLTGLALIATESLQNAGGLILHTDSPELAALIDSHYGFEPDLWPIFSFTDLSASSSQRIPSSESEIVVYAPGNMQWGKGYDLVASLAKRLDTATSEAPFTLRARVVLRDGTDRRLIEAASILEDSADVIRGVLDDVEYARYLAEADVVLVPYRQSEFGTRTSAVVVDAMKLGKPIVTTAGTWMGRVVAEAESGETFADGDIDAMERALSQVVSNLGLYKSKAQKSSREWKREAGLRDFVKEIKETARTDTTAELNEGDILNTIAAIFEAATPTAGSRTYETEIETRLKDAESEILRLQSALSSAQTSVGYRLAQKIAHTVKRNTPIHRGLRRLALLLVGDHKKSSTTQ